MRRNTSRAFCLLPSAFCLVLVACSSGPPPQTRNTKFREELSHQIEEMLRQHERLSRGSGELPLAAPLEVERDPESWIVPVAGISPADLRSNFGEARTGSRAHMGIDIFAPRGTAVVAVTSGVVKLITERRLAGRCLWLESDRGDMFFYAHFDRWAPLLVEGDHVEQGTILGYVGTTGNASGGRPHLHFEIHREGVALDPYLVLRRGAPRQEQIFTRASE